MHAAVAPDRDFEPLGERVGDAHAHAMQPAGKTVGAARAFIELAARMQTGEDDFDRRHFLFGMHADRNAATFVLDHHTTVGAERQGDVSAEAAERFVGGVVDDFLDDVQRIVGPRIHAGALPNRLEAFQDLDRRFRIFLLG